MKLLIISESPLELVGGQYFAADTWIRFIQNLAACAGDVTLWAPVRETAGAGGIPEGSWRVERGSLRIEHQDCYNSYFSYYRLWPKRWRVWRREAERLIASHDVTVLRHPSPMIGMITRQAGRLGKPLVLMVAGNLETQSDRILSSRGLKKIFYKAVVKGLAAQEKRCARRAALVYAYSDEIAARHKEVGARLRRFRTPHLNESDFVMREDTCGGSEIRLVRVSWLLPTKGLESLLEAVSLLSAVKGSIRLEIIGKERAPGYRAALERLAAKLGITDKVVFSGWVPFDRIGEAYRRSDIQVISSLSEGTPRCMVEGFARGLPLVSTPAGGCADVLVDGKNALVVPAGNAQAIAGAVKRIILEPGLRKELIRNGYETAREVTFDRLGMRFIEDLRQVVAHADRAWD